MNFPSLKFFLFFTLFSVPVFGQDVNVTKLLDQVRKSKDSTNNIEIYHDIADYYSENGDIKQAIAYGRRSLDLAKFMGDSIRMINALNILGNAYSSRGILSAGISMYLDALNICEIKKDSADLSALLSALGAEYTSEGNYERAENYLNRALELSRSKNDTNSEAGQLNNVGILFRKKGEHEKAINYYHQALRLAIAAHNHKTEMQTFNNLGSVYSLLGKQDSALKYFESSLKLSRDLNNSYQEEIVLSNIGIIYMQNGKHELAEQTLLRALQLAREVNDLEGEEYISSDLSTFYDGMKKPAMAFPHLKRFLEIKNLLQKENYEKERERDEIVKQFETEKLAMLKEQEKRELNEEAKRKKQQYVIYSVSVCLIIVAIFLFLLYKRFQLTREQKKVIESQKHLVEEKQKEILDSINYAKRIQDSLFDNFDHVKQFFSDAFLLNKPKDIVSGDFYWITKKTLKDKHELFFIAVCDSTGHGVPGGFMSLLNTAYLSEAINEKNIYDPGKVFDYVRERLIHSISKNNQKDGFDGILMRFEKINDQLNVSYAAAHSAPVIVRNSAATFLDATSMPVGYGERQAPFQTFELSLQKNDQIYLYSDGYADQFGGPKGKKFKYKALNDLLSLHSGSPMEEQRQALINRFEEWKGNLDQIDDVLMIGLKIS